MECIPGDYLMKLVERMPRVYKVSSVPEVSTLKNLKYKIIHNITLIGYYITHSICVIS